jgi:hypothetical protein
VDEVLLHPIGTVRNLDNEEKNVHHNFGTSAYLSLRQFREALSGASDAANCCRDNSSLQLHAPIRLHRVSLDTVTTVPKPTSYPKVVVQKLMVT